MSKKPHGRKFGPSPVQNDGWYRRDDFNGTNHNVNRTDTGGVTPVGERPFETARTTETSPPDRSARVCTSSAVYGGGFARRVIRRTIAAARACVSLGRTIIINPT